MQVVLSIDTTTRSSTRRRAPPSAQRAAKRRRLDEENAAVVESRGPARRVAAAMMARGLVGGVDYRVHTYTEAAMLAAYPVLDELQRIPRIAKCREHRSGACSLAWGFHAEALNVWFQAQSSPPDQVWCFEDDVGWAGDLATFFTRVAKIRGDLVTADTDLRVAHDWWWKDSHSAKFAERFLAPREAERRVSREHVQRFSRRLLDRLHALSRARCSAWSETSVVTVCATEPDLVLARLPPDLQGRPFQHDGRISEEDWRQISKSRSPRKRDKLYHALKF